MNCAGCGHDFHGLTECGEIIDADDRNEIPCPCQGDMAQAREDWELNNWKAAREDEYDAALDAVYES